MIKILDPKNDVVFQKLFGMKKHKHILISFLNSVLNLSGDNAIKDVDFEEKSLDVSLIASEKLSILDLHVTIENSIFSYNHILILKGNSTHCVRWVSDSHQIIDLGSLLIIW